MQVAAVTELPLDYPYIHQSTGVGLAAHFRFQLSLPGPLQPIVTGPPAAAATATEGIAAGRTLGSSSAPLRPYLSPIQFRIDANAPWSVLLLQPAFIHARAQVAAYNSAKLPHKSTGFGHNHHQYQFVFRSQPGTPQIMGLNLWWRLIYWFDWILCFSANFLLPLSLIFQTSCQLNLYWN